MKNKSESKVTNVGIIIGIILNLYILIEKITSLSFSFIDSRYITYPLALISVIILTIACFKWKYEHNSSTFIFLKKSYFIGLIVFILSLSFVIGMQVVSNNQQQNCRERIVVLLPLDKNRANEPAFQDGKRQAYGFIDLIENNNELNKKYEVIFVDHQMNTKVAIDIVQKELKMGTNYFVSTMSHISERLSLDFESLVKKYKKGEKEKPKLIITVSSSNNISVIKNRIYRYYIRSNEESKLLAHYYSSQNSDNRLISIYGNDNYGNRAREIFNDNYLKPFDINVALEINWKKERVKEEIERKISNSNDSNNTFFIVHYGSGLDDIISSLYELGHSGQLIISHPITVEEWQKPICKELSNFEWVTCYPESNTGSLYQSNDIIRDFVYFTLLRLIETIETSKIRDCDFDFAWKEVNEPNKIRFNINDAGDSEIKLKINHINQYETFINY